MTRWSPGIPDHLFFQRKPEKGLITKAEIRVLSLARLALRESAIVWDIGAGSGAVAIEAALLAPQGRVFAVEKNAADAAIMRRNIEKFQVNNVTVIEGRAPEALARITDEPEAVFIGGSGGEMAEVIQVSLARLPDGGRLVINVVTIDNLAAATQACKDSGYPFEVTLLQAARSKPILDLIRFDALNPVFLISLVKDRTPQEREPQEDV
ncbi:MAG TPA: precorrin-6Y C5,15-methyltransferase (decarboxylating) subunit CbiT [Methylomirabilota bacterium]|jgi:precorrin-6Y C5,15-methyltransferase (decarboxylating)|nr:precorrin-6Y C5,15-methyltransferase (decarboxylating) subunit CbiT [Methylomirabilota bacterium]